VADAGTGDQTGAAETEDQGPVATRVRWGAYGVPIAVGHRRRGSAPGLRQAVDSCRRGGMSQVSAMSISALVATNRSRLSQGDTPSGSATRSASYRVTR
jgi:hypothetical protein